MTMQSDCGLALGFFRCIGMPWHGEAALLTNKETAQQLGSQDAPPN